MFRKILIANRGEIALRVVRACRDLGVMSCVAYSQADANTKAVLEADETVCIGPAPSAQSYLNMMALIGAANSRGCDAVHPGYGFLSENPEFARACVDNDLVFIGPDAATIERMGEKSNAKETMKQAGVPVIPGSEGTVATAEEALQFAQAVGFPVLIKASAGGGGKGMRVATNSDVLAHEFEAARAEAKNAFGNDEVYLEKLLLRPRHIEVQVLADAHGNAIHLNERDCSVQRRHQKLVEEAPSPALDEAMREAIGEAALKAVRAVNYVNAGTIEFLLDTDGKFYFMEMNTRIQVEHPVTEQITGLDLVAEQIRVAAGLPLSATESPRVHGHAIEFRINAEDPTKNFMPNPGLIQKLELPGGPGVRLDTHAYAGYRVPPTYDSLVAKLIVHGKTRDEAIARARRALKEFKIEGIATTIPFHLALLQNEAFNAGQVYTDFIEKELPEFLSDNA